MWGVLIFALFPGAPLLLYLDHVLDAEHFRQHLPAHVLALIGIIAGVIAIYYERNLDKGFDNIQEIVVSASTRFLGVWPGHLEQIAELVRTSNLIGTSEDEFIASVDTFGYGHVSGYSGFRKYFAEIEEAAKKRSVTVKILVDPADAAERSINDQLKEMADDEFAKFKGAFQGSYGTLIKTKLESREALTKADLEVQNRYCSQLVDVATERFVQVGTRKEAQENKGVFFWMVRRKGIPREAIFAYPRFGGTGKGYAFRTMDPKLMDIFSSDFESKWPESIKIEPGNLLYPKTSPKGEGADAS
jgi:hypothetical protein